MKIGFTGTQEGMTISQRGALEEYLETLAYNGNEFVPIEVHHGLCIGADRQFHSLCVSMGFNIVGHPPKNTSKMAEFNLKEFVRLEEPKEYLDRNSDIVKDTECLFVCPKGFQEETRSGTWATFRRALWANKPRVVFFPDGSIKRYGQ